MHIKLKKIGIFTVIFVVLMSCSSKNNDMPNVPAWMNSLSNSHVKYVYGVAKNVSVSRYPPIHYAKLNAINNWLLSEGKVELNINENLAEMNHYQFGNTKLYFVDSFVDKTGTFVLVSNQNIKSEVTNSSLMECELRKCNPGFLCKNQDAKISVLAVSAPTAHPNDQIRNLLDNGQQLARMIDSSHISGYVHTVAVADEHLDVTNVQERYRIEELNNKVKSVQIDNICRYKGSVVAELVFNGTNKVKNHNWLEEPNYKGTLGVVAEAKGQTSTGRLSELIKIAARKGLFEMAKAKNLSLENELELNVNNGGGFSLIRKSQQKTESVVSAFIADMKMELNGNYQPNIKIWLLENKGEL